MINMGKTKQNKSNTKPNFKLCPICKKPITVPAWKYCSDECNKTVAKIYGKIFREKHPNYVNEWRKKHPGYFKNWTKNRKDLHKKFINDKIDKGL